MNSNGAIAHRDSLSMSFVMVAGSLLGSCWLPDALFPLFRRRLRPKHHKLSSLKHIIFCSVRKSEPAAPSLTPSDGVRYGGRKKGVSVRFDVVQFCS